MRNLHKRGFTLIELLVVVLIIGILAAVTVPQYQKAVEKSRFTQGLVFVKAVGEAQEAFYLANGQYADNINKLDISISCPDKLKCTTTQSITAVVFLPPFYDAGIGYRYLHQEEIPEYQGLLYCSCRKDRPEAVKICSHFGKKATRENPSNPDWDIYRIN